jgi:hypothetical protein
MVMILIVVVLLWNDNAACDYMFMEVGRISVIGSSVFWPFNINILRTTDVL